MAVYVMKSEMEEDGDDQKLWVEMKLVVAEMVPFHCAMNVDEVKDDELENEDQVGEDASIVHENVTVLMEEAVHVSQCVGSPYVF